MIIVESTVDLSTPTGAMRTEKQYENFIMEAEWRHLSKGGNSGTLPIR